MASKSLIGHLVGVTWRDAQADASAHMGKYEIEQAKSYIFTTYGVLARDDRDPERPKLAALPGPIAVLRDLIVAVAAERGEDGIFRGVTIVPCEMIVSIRDFGAV